MRIAPVTKDKSVPKNQEGLWTYRVWLSGSYHTVKAKKGLEAYELVKQQQHGVFIGSRY